MRALHPQRPPPTVPEHHHLPPGPELVPDLVRRMLHTFPTGTAPGPSGLRANHLLEAGVPGQADGLFQQLTAVLNLLGQGGGCPEAAGILAGASLVAVPKPQGGVRPIAIGEVLRRLVGKCLMSLVKEDAARYFWPTQAGVAVPGGVEAVVHASRAWVERQPPDSKVVALKLDFKNAFNTVSRQRLLDQCFAHFPTLSRWASFLYSSPSDLHFGSFPVVSAAGVQQGDPLGPLLFAAALQPLTVELKGLGLDLCTFYLDDGFLAGSIPAVAGALTHLQQHAATIGLELNLSKCDLICVGGTQATDLGDKFPAALLQAPDGSCRLSNNFELLGAAIGDADFMGRHVLARVGAATDLLEALANLEDPQVGLRLLRSCAGHARLLHNMRCSPPSPQMTALVDFDARVRGCLASLTGLHLDRSQWRQATRPFGKAGLGLRAAAVDAPAAYLASLGASAARCVELDGGFGAAGLPSSPTVQLALSHLNGHLAQPLTSAIALTKTQKDLTTLLDQASWDTHLQASGPAMKALLWSEAGQGAGAFLTAVPYGRRCLEPAAFNAEVRHRLGVPDASEDTWCPQCDAVLDCRSFHAGVCAAGGKRTQRHNAVRDLLASWCARAGLQPEKERRELLLPQRPDDCGVQRRRPADIYLPCLQGSPSALDLAITGFQRIETLPQASQASGSSAAAYASVKSSHHNTAQLCAEQGIHFIPVVAETTGTWDATSAQVLRTISRAAAAREGAEPGGHHALLLQELSVTIRGYRARAALRRRAALRLSTPTAECAAAVLLET